MSGIITTDVVSTAITLQKTSGNQATTAVSLSPPGGDRWVLQFNVEATAGDGGDSFIPCFQTTWDNGTTWLDLASGAAVAGGVVAAANDWIVCSTPPAAAREAPSDGALAASTINQTALGHKVRIKGAYTDADDDGRWKINSATLTRYM